MPTTEPAIARTTDEHLRCAHLLYGGGGLALVGAGLSVAMDAGQRRAAGAQTVAWVVRGTAGLTLLGAGLSCFGEAVARRTELRLRGYR